MTAGNIVSMNIFWKGSLRRTKQIFVSSPRPSSGSLQSRLYCAASRGPKAVTERPAAFAVGVGIISPSGKVLDTSYPAINFGENFNISSVLSRVLGRNHDRTSTHRVDQRQLADAANLISDASKLEESGSTTSITAGVHQNIEAWDYLLELARLPPPPGGQRVLVAAFINALTDDAVDVHDIFLRLHLLSHRQTQPHNINLDGMWGKLNTVVWTNMGPFEQDDFELRRQRHNSKGRNHDHMRIHSIDKFPPMTDYVVPSGVRIADTSRVRLGAYLSKGTVVMQEGFINANAGTLGASMVEGRISAGVVIGDGSDIGGGASIMGTLSGGGQEVISIGKSCLIGANAGVGISLGDGCVIEAGLYVTAGSKVQLPDGQVVAARVLSGKHGLLFRRNSQTGSIEVLQNGHRGSWQGLNLELHAG